VTRQSCVLLLSDHEELADRAERIARERFEVRAVARHARHDRALANTITRAQDTEFLFNVLSAVYIPTETLAHVSDLAINFHPGPPEWPGVGSASYAIYDGQLTFGVTAHLLTERFDAGAILRVRRFPILAEDTCETLFQRALARSVDLFDELSKEISEGEYPGPSGERWARRAVTRVEFERWMTLSPDASPQEVARKERALRHSRFPGPFVEVGGYRFELPPRSAPPSVGKSAR